MNPAQDAVSSNILPSAFEHVRNGIDSIVLFPGRAARLLISNTSLRILGTLAILSATVGQKTDTNALFIKNITAPLLMDI